MKTLLLLITALMAPFTARAQAGDRSWAGEFGRAGFDDAVKALAVYQGQVVAGGLFSISDSTNLSRLARWDGRSWQTLGGGVTLGCVGWREVRGLAEYGGELVVTGFFGGAGGVPAKHIAAWNGTTWHALGSGLAFQDTTCARGQCLAVYGGDLVVGGTFERAGGVPARNVARWNGSSWAPLGEGLPVEALALTVVQGELFATWSVYHEEQGAEAAVLRWDGTSWQQVGARFDGYVDALMDYNGRLVAGGVFGNPGGVPLAGVVLWDGSAWTALGGGIGSPGEFSRVDALATFGGDLVASGLFSEAGGVPAAAIARWDGVSWKPMGSGLRNVLGFAWGRALTVQNGELFVGGMFTQAGGVPANHVARWNGITWSGMGAPGEGIDGFVTDLAVHDDALVAAGRFEQAGGVTAHDVARWDGRAWVAMDAGLPPASDVSPLFLYGGQLHAAVTTGSLDSTRASVVRWDGATWSAVGPAANQRIRCAAVYAGALVVGGAFTSLGSTPALRIARWDGTRWEELGGGIGGPFWSEVRALLVDRGGLVAAGTFDTAGGVACANVARWNGTSWSALGPGLRATPPEGVVGLVAYGNGFVALGSFRRPGSLDMDGVAHWDGGVWLPLGYGLHNGSFSGSAVSGVANGRILFVTGSFVNAGAALARGIARWDGATWSALGSGVSAPSVLAMFQGDLYVAGFFHTAGGKRAESISRWHNPNVPVDASDLSAAVEGQRVHLTWSLSETAVEELAGVQVERAGTETGPYVLLTPVLLEPRPRMEFTDEDFPANRILWYRLVLRDRAGKTTFVGPVQALGPALPRRTTLYLPVEPAGGGAIHLRYDIAPPGALVKLGVYDVRGREIWSAPAGVQAAGTHSRDWPRLAPSGARVPRGVYLIRLRAGTVSRTRKLVLTHG